MVRYLRHLFLPHESNNQRARILHPTGLIVVLGLWVIFQFSLETVSRMSPQILGYASQIGVEDIIQLTNRRREAEGLNDLVLDPQLSAAAAQKAADMVARDYWAHVSPVGTQPWFFITEAGYTYRYAGENLARDFTNAPDVVQAWMDSPTHKENLLNAKYQDIGVAVIDGTMGGRETTLVVQMFGTKLSATAARPQTGSSALAPPVRAAQIATSPVPVQAVTAPVTVAVSPFAVTKTVGVGLVGLLILVLALDVLLVSRRKLWRWTSKSFAHLALMVFLLLASLIVSVGQIL